MNATSRGLSEPELNVPEKIALSIIVNHAHIVQNKWYYNLSKSLISYEKVKVLEQKIRSSYLALPALSLSLYPLITV